MEKRVRQQIPDHRIWKIYGTEYKEITKTILAAADLAGRIGDRQARIGIKPNLVVASPAQFGGTTHPEVVAGIIEYLQENGFSRIIVAEGSWVGDRTADAFDYCGYNALSEKYGVPLVDTQKEKWHEKDCAGMKLNITNVVDRIDFLINVPVMKGHCQTRMTCALKNMKGLIPNSEKSRFHRLGLHKPIAHLQKGIHQDFIVVDHICGDPAFEEGGNPVQTNRMFLGTDPVQVDSYGCQLMGLAPEDVPYIGLAEKWGAGSSDVKAGDVVRLNRPESACGYPAPSGLVKRLTGNVHADSACSSCFASLARALYIAKEDGIIVNERISIGQGYQGKTVKGIGIGRCCDGAQKCVKGCPPTASAIVEMFRELA